MNTSCLLCRKLTNEYYSCSTCQNCFCVGEFYLETLDADDEFQYFMESRVLSVAAEEELTLRPTLEKKVNCLKENCKGFITVKVTGNVSFIVNSASELELITASSYKIASPNKDKGCILPGEIDDIKEIEDRDFEAEYEELMVKQRKALIGLYFSYDDDLKSIVENAIKSATRYIDLAMYTFTDNDIAKSLVSVAKLSSIPIRVILDEVQSENLKMMNECINTLKESSLDIIQIRYLSGIQGNGIMHHKFMIVDDILLKGSFNYTFAANNTNYEDLEVTNLSIDKFQRRFQTLWEKSKTYLAKKIFSDECERISPTISSPKK